jgi:pyruvate/2-oxoacid:ferredoxin oxidoreductase alpha subunit
MATAEQITTSATATAQGLIAADAKITSIHPSTPRDHYLIGREVQVY